MRTKNSIINILASLLTYVIITISSLITPKILEQLGQFTPGLNSTFLNTISLMSIVEMGVGVAIVYKLYEPIEKKNYTKIASMLNFYKIAYKIISFIILILGAVASFIVPSFLDKNASASYERSWISFIFMFYVIDVVASYLFAHKRAMLTADQKNYINNVCHGVSVAVACILQIIVLNLFHSFLIYAVVKIICTLLENIFIYISYDLRYKHIDLKTNEKLSSVEKNEMFKNLKALLLHKVATAAVRSTPGLVMSSINTLVSGHYSVYMLIANGFMNVTEQAFGGVTASFGNLLITESKEKVFSRFKILYFINYLIYSFLCAGIFNCVTPFITLYYGKSWLMSPISVIIILIYFYVMGMRQSILLVRISAGIYRPDRYFAVLEALVNIVLTVFMAKLWGINGILSANIISMMLIPMWTQPYLVYKNVFFMSLSGYYKRFLIYMILTILNVLICYYVCSYIKIESLLLTLLFRILASILIPNIFNLIVFWKTLEMKYIREILLRILRKRF